MEKAIVLMSGGVDSTVCLYLAKKSYDVVAVAFNYGQKHLIELDYAKATCNRLKIPLTIIDLDFSFLNSPLLQNNNTHSLITSNQTIDTILKPHLPSAYVPARNIIFLSYATSLAENYQAKHIFIGCNKLDVNFPDCSLNFLNAYNNVLSSFVTTGLQIQFPLLNLNKNEIFKLANELHIDLETTWSCYKPLDKKPCDICDACILRDYAKKNMFN